MSEPESLATEEPLEKHIQRHAYDRLLMLSDGVFAIATTLAALEIRLPEGIRNTDAALSLLARPLISYAISFVVIAIFWISHRDLFARVGRVTRGLTALTMAFLFAISLVPLGIKGIAIEASNAGFRLYVLTMLACGVLNSAMWCFAAFSPGVMRADVPAEQRLVRALGSVAMPLIFLAILLLPMDRFATILVPIVAGLVLLRRRVLPAFIKRKFAADSAGERLKRA